MTATIISYAPAVDPSTGVQETYNGTYGLLYKHMVGLDNGMSGKVNSKTAQGSFTVGDTVEFETTVVNGNTYVKKIMKPKENFSGGGGNSKEYLISISYKYACMLGKSSGVTEMNVISKVGNQIYDWLSASPNQKQDSINLSYSIDLLGDKMKSADIWEFAKKMTLAQMAKASQVAPQQQEVQKVAVAPPQHAPNFDLQRVAVAPPQHAPGFEVQKVAVQQNLVNEDDDLPF